MSPVLILTPVIAILAFLGYVWLLSYKFWIAMVLTLTVGYALIVSSPFESGQLVYWAIASVVFATALLAMSLLPSPKKFVVEVKTKKKIKTEAAYDIVIDGTNVIFWNGDPSIGTLRMVVDHLRERGVMPYVFFDASSKHLLRNTVLDEEAFRNALDLPADRVMLCPDATKADDFILKFARKENLPIVSNDTFSGRQHAAEGLRLIKGMVADGNPMLQEI